MTFSYLSTSPGSSDRSFVRLKVGDTSSGSNVLENEDIDALIDDVGADAAVPAAARSIGAWYARKVDKAAGKLRISFSQASQHYFDLAERLERQMGVSASLYAGGISEDDKQTEDERSDRVEPRFKRDQFSNPGTLDTSTDE